MNPVTEAYMRFYTFILLAIFAIVNLVFYRAWVIFGFAMAAMLLIVFLPTESETEEHEYESHH
jgi:Flp pilus assembly protein TadB